MISFLAKLLKSLPFLGGIAVAAAVFLAIRHGQMDQFSIALIGLGFVLFLAVFLKIEAASLRYYVNLLLLSTLMFANLAVIYLLAANHNARWDLTRRSRYTLAPQTRRVLANLKKPVEIEVIATQNEPYYSYLRLWSARSPNLSFTIRNPYKTPETAQMPGEEIQIDNIWVRSLEEPAPSRTSSSSTSSTVSEAASTSSTPSDPAKRASAQRKSRIPFPKDADIWQLEGDILNAILRVTQERAVRLFFVTRHGEKDPDFVPGERGDQRSISRFANVLYERAMEIVPLDLQADRLVPDDCDMLAIVGPLVDYEESEILALRKYLNRGGGLLVMLDPAPLASPLVRLPRLRGLLAEYGLNVGDGFVSDFQSHSAEHNELVPLVHVFNPGHVITDSLQGVSADLPLYHVCPVVKRDDAPKDMTYVSLMLSSEQSWNVMPEEYAQASETNTSIKAPPSSQWGKLSMAAAAWPADDKAAKRRPRIVAFGDSDFLTDARLGNLEAALGYLSVNWLVRQEALIALPPRIVDQTPMFLTPRQRNLVSILSVVVIPFAVFFGGLSYTTLRRRKR